MRDKRRGEAKPILDMIENLFLISLLPSGTVARRQRDEELTINLMLSTAKLAEAMICCHIHNTQHGSDHLPIKTIFNLAIPDGPESVRFLFKDAPWKKMNNAIIKKCQGSSLIGTGT